MPSTSKPLLILDLDETLFFASESPLSISHDCRVGPYYVYRRPYLAEFLDTCQQWYQLAVWSSSSSDYVEHAVSYVLPQDLSLAFAWSRERCIQRYHPETKQRYFIKDLKKVKRQGYDLGRVLIVDDTPQKVRRNYGNAVYPREFVGARTDQELRYLSEYLLSIVACQDYRSLEKRNWRSKVLNKPNP